MGEIIIWKLIEMMTITFLQAPHHYLITGRMTKTDERGRDCEKFGICWGRVNSVG